jgi:hypothetical protein
MPSITYIKYIPEKGFWINEFDLEIVCTYIADAFEQKGLKTKSNWYMEIYEDFLDIKLGRKQRMMFIGFKLLEFKSEREEEIINILRYAKKNIEKEGEELSAAKLNDMQKVKDRLQTHVEWTGPIKTEDLSNVIDIMIRMIKKEWTDGDYVVRFK